MRTPMSLSFLSNFAGEVCRYRLWLWLILGARGGPYERVQAHNLKVVGSNPTPRNQPPIDSGSLIAPSLEASSRVARRP